MDFFFLDGLRALRVKVSLSPLWYLAGSGCLIDIRINKESEKKAGIKADKWGKW